MEQFKVGDKVWFKGRFAENFSLRGEVEYLRHGAAISYGVRLENGNFQYADKVQLKRSYHEREEI